MSRIRKYISEVILELKYDDMDLMDLIKSLALQADGKILMAGYVGSFPQSFVVARYLANGTLDTSFNDTGKVRTPIGSESTTMPSANHTASEPMSSFV